MIDEKAKRLGQSPMCPRVVDVFPCQCHDHRRVLDNSAETVPTRRRYLVLSNVALNTRTPAIQHILPAVPSRTVNPTQMLVIKPISAPADPRAADRFDGHGCGDIHNEENDAWRDMDYARRRVATARWQGCGRLLPVQRTQDPLRERDVGGYEMEREAPHYLERGHGR